MPHRTTKKLLGKAKKKVKDIYSRPRKDRLPSLRELEQMARPRLLVAPGPAALLKNPRVLAALAVYHTLEQTERYWAPPIEAQAGWTAKQYREYEDWYERNVRSLYAGSEIDPDSPLGYTPPRRGPIGPPAPEVFAPQSVKRKVSKANKATKMAWRMLLKGRKGKLTQKACQKLLKKCSMIASKANPNTKSRIGTANNGTTKACKKIRKSIWGTNKRY
jgi:hypothetical protein